MPNVDAGTCSLSVKRRKNHQVIWSIERSDEKPIAAWYLSRPNVEEQRLAAMPEGTFERALVAALWARAVIQLLSAPIRLGAARSIVLWSYANLGLAALQ